MPDDNLEKDLSNFEKSYKYKIEEKKLGVYIFRLIYFLVFVVIHLYLLLYVIYNSKTLLNGMLVALAVTLLFILIYLPLIIIREYFILPKGLVIAFSIFGRFKRSIVSSLWSNASDITYRRLGPRIIRISFLRSCVDITYKNTFFSKVLRIVLPAISSRDVYMIVGKVEQIDYMENKLYGVAQKGIF